MKPQHLIPLIFFIAGSYACAADDATLQQREIAAYSALINHGLAGDVPLVVLGAVTTGDPAAVTGQDDAAALIKELGVPADALSDWQQRNRTRTPLPQPLNIDASYLLLDETDLADLFKTDDPGAGWESFFSRYAKAPGLLRLSRAGFDAALEHALVYVEHHCGAACGSGRLMHLSRSGETWQVRDAALIWMAE